MRAMVTGGAGFIGSALVRRLVAAGSSVLNFDKLTYAGNLATVAQCASESNYGFTQGDVANAAEMAEAFDRFQPDVVFHLAAESHVDRSIDGPGAFIKTNILGTYTLLEAALVYWRQRGFASSFRVVLISTDEVYGSLGETGAFSEGTAYAPNSPYSASKAAADHLGRAWFQTFGLPVINTNCSNNYGPFQHPEKLIPTVIRSALAGNSIPIYGAGSNVRDWIHVDDHVQGLLDVARSGRLGERYNLGGRAEMTNLELAKQLCDTLDLLHPRADGARYADQIAFVVDRPGHDHRYAVDSTKAETELAWKRRETLETGLASTVSWYLDHHEWLAPDAEPGRLGLNGARQ